LTDSDLGAAPRARRDPDRFRDEPGLVRGIELFNEGEFWEAHEAWEGAWMPHRRQRDSDFFKGLIQVAAGWHHYRRNNRRGALIKWGTGADYLRRYLPARHGVELASLVRHTDRSRARLAKDGHADLKPPRLEPAE
jgi:predicted metal-dependent hydrolase